MAINTDVDQIPLGDRFNRKQAIVLIPAKAEANKPGMFNLQSVSGTTVSDGYLFRDTSGRLKTHTSVPTDVDAQGTLYDTGTSGADTALSNLASVQIPDVGDLIPVNNNTVTLGSDGKGFSSAFLSTSLVFNQTTRNLTLTASEPASSARTVNFGDPGGADSVAYLAASQALTTKTYNGLTVVAGSNAISLTQGTATIAVAAAGDLNVGAAGDVDFGTGAIQFNGTAAFDQATGTTVDINADLTVSGAATIDQDLSASGAPTWTSLVTCQGIVNTTAVIDSTAQVQIGADNVKMTWGVDDESDCYIQYTGSVMQFWDTTTGPWTLNELATGTTLNPTINGNFTITDGNFTWTNAASGESAVWTLAATTVDSIQIESSNTTADVIQITADATANGRLLVLDADGGVGASGEYLECLGTGSVFKIGEYGATTITGTASGTDALTLTAGDILLTAGLIDLTLGNIDLADGMIVADTIQNLQNYFKRSFSGSSTPVLAIENTHATGTGYAMSIIQAASSGASGGLSISNKGTSPLLHLSAGVARTGYVIHIPMADQLAEHAIIVDGAYTGAVDEGMIDIKSTGVLIAGGNLLRVNQNTGAPATESHLVEIIGAGTWAGSTLGTCLNITDTGSVAGTSYAAYIASTANSALNLVTGAVATSNLVCTGVDAQTSSMIVVDGSTTNGWDGADDVGCVHINTKILNVAGAAGLHVVHVGQPAVGGEGVCARFLQTGTARTDSYVVEMSATATGGALHCSSGHAVFEESATIAGGYLTSPTTVTSDSTNGNLTYTTAMLLGGMILRDGIDGDRTDITATATEIVAAIPGCANGSSFEFFVKNDDATHDIIVSAGVDVTLVGGNVTIDTGEMAHFKAVVTDASTEAVSVYNLGIRVIAQT